MGYACRGLVRPCVPANRPGDKALQEANPSSSSESPVRRPEGANGSGRLGDPSHLITELVQHAVEEKASDIHLRVKNHPLVRVDGVLEPLREYPMLSASDMEAVAKSVMSPRHWKLLQERFQADLSLGVEGVGRLRVNVYYQRGTIAMALRVLSGYVPVPDELGLPELAQDLAHFERGLVILTGATGSGKSTTIASLINEINTRYAKHIITIEDPVEYLFEDKRSIISQRELLIDALTFADAMKAALREDPDVILLGEMRDPETMDIALTAAETGHLVFSTLHAPATAETITRMISSFEPEAQPTLRAKLAQNLRAVIAQRLLPRASGQGRVLACEILTVSARVRELILDPLKVKDIADLVKKGAIVEGMLSFDQHLFQLCRRDEITEETALQHASSPTDLKLALDGFAVS